MQHLDHIVIAGVNAQLFGLNQQNLPLHQLGGNLLLDVVNNHRVVGVLRVLALDLLAGALAHLLLGDLFAGGEQAVVPVGVDHGVGIGA